MARLCPGVEAPSLFASLSVSSPQFSPHMIVALKDCFFH